MIIVATCFCFFIVKCKVQKGKDRCRNLEVWFGLENQLLLNAGAARHSKRKEKSTQKKRKNGDVHILKIK